MPDTPEHVFTPSELNQEARLHIEMGFPRIFVEGEVSNLSRPTSGHLYFSLKDERAQLRCALFRSAANRQPLSMENGMKVVARGRLSLYEPRGDFQMIVDSVRDAGEGDLQRQFEELKARLQAEGLFEPARKRALPAFPTRIGVVTSPRGAALHDILQILERRWPLAAVRVYPVLVQGATAPTELRAALAAANRQAWAELLIVGRGGGSLEDLAAFNDEGVARAVAASAIPVISAVGHEVDFSICDFVADLRAPTPSAAAELATPDQAVLVERFRRLERQLETRIRDRLRRDAQRRDHAAHRLQQRHPATRLDEQARRLQVARRSLEQSLRRRLDSATLRLSSARQRLAVQAPQRRVALLATRLEAARGSLNRLVRLALRRSEQRLAERARTLQAVSPLQVIGRGYAVLTSPATGAVVSRTGQVAAGDRLSAQLRDGQIDCLVEAVRPDQA